MPAELRFVNRYWALRHGISTANERGIIVSRPENGISPEFGLSPAGRAHCEERFRAIATRKSALNPKKTLIVSSDFSRALETAHLFAQALSLGPPQVDERWRERFFGDLEGGSNAGYEEIWRRDAETADHHDRGCESVAEVIRRIADSVRDWESRQQQHDIVFVSHGDTLQMAQCFFRGTDPRLHRSLPHLNNAELRSLHPADPVR